jgi:hypothetical protein
VQTLMATIELGACSRDNAWQVAAAATGTTIKHVATGLCLTA